MTPPEKFQRGWLVSNDGDSGWTRWHEGRNGCIWSHSIFWANAWFVFNKGSHKRRKRHHIGSSQPDGKKKARETGQFTLDCVIAGRAKWNGCEDKPKQKPFCPTRNVGAPKRARFVCW
jgi:hypothetical protein